MGEETKLFERVMAKVSEREPSQWERVAAGVHVRVICSLLVVTGLATFAWPILHGGAPGLLVLLMSGALVLLGVAGIAPKAPAIFAESARQLIAGWRSKGSGDP